MRPVQNNFTAGEVSKRARGRYDLGLYSSGAEILENLFVQIEGGVTRTPGTRYVARTKYADKRARLVRFTASDEKDVVIEAGEGYLRYFDAETFTPVLNGASLVETATGLTLSHIDQLYWFQSADVMWFTAKTGDLKPKILRRLSATNWSLIDFDIRRGPFLPPSLAGISLTTSGLTGAITVNGPGRFKQGHVGARFRMWTRLGANPFPKWKAEEEGITAGALREYEGRVYAAVGAGKASNQPPIHDEPLSAGGGIPDGGGQISWEFQHDLSGVFIVTSFSNASVVQATVEERLPENFTAKWAEAYFSDYRGYPFVGGIFSSRLYFAGAPDFPDTIWGSRIDGYNSAYADFKQSAGGGEVLDDDAVVRTLADAEVHRIAWMISGEQIVLGHGGGVVRVTGPSINEPITPAGASAVRPEAPPGACFDARAVRAGQDIVYSSTSGRKIIALDPSNFSFQTLSARASHIGAARFIDFVYLQDPSRLFALREDGKLFACAFDREQKVIAWSRLTPAGNYEGADVFVESICAARGADGRERLWLLCARTIDTDAVRFIEVMELDFDGEETLADAAVFGDLAVTVDKWNADKAKQISIFLVGGATGVRDDEVKLTPIGHTIDAGWIGRRVRVRRLHAPARTDDIAGGAQIRIDSVSGGYAYGVLETDLPAELLATPQAQWALCDSTIAGLDHLNGETVGVYVDGADIGDMPVSGGFVSPVEADGSPRYFARGCACLRKPWRGRSLPLVVQTRDGVSIGDIIKASGVMVLLLDAHAANSTVQLIVNGRAQQPELLAARDEDDLVSLAPGLRTGSKTLKLSGGRSRRVAVEFGGDGMGPATVLAVGVRMEE